MSFFPQYLTHSRLLPIVSLHVLFVMYMYIMLYCICTLHMYIQCNIYIYTHSIYTFRCMYTRTRALSLSLCLSHTRTHTRARAHTHTHTFYNLLCSRLLLAYVQCVASLFPPPSHVLAFVFSRSFFVNMYSLSCGRAFYLQSVVSPCARTRAEPSLSNPRSTLSHLCALCSLCCGLAHTLFFLFYGACLYVFKFMRPVCACAFTCPQLYFRTHTKHGNSHLNPLMTEFVLRMFCRCSINL